MNTPTRPLHNPLYKSLRGPLRSLASLAGLAALPLLGALALPACDAPEGDAFGVGEITERMWLSGGTRRLNGPDNVELSVDGEKINSWDLDGATYNGVRLDAVCLTPKSLGKQICFYPAEGDTIWVQKSQLYAKKGQLTVKGKDFAGSRWHFSLDYDRQGGLDSTIIVDFKDAQVEMTPQGNKFWAYYPVVDPATATGLVTKYLDQSPPLPLCAKDPETNSIRATVTEGFDVKFENGNFFKRDRTAFLACEAGAIGKAQMSWGYLFHILADNPIQYLELATRVVRADYCGDGESWTEHGLGAYVEDSLAINTIIEPDLKTEAHWVLGEGAVCIGRPRNPDFDTDAIKQACGIPYCKEDADLGHYKDDIRTMVD